MFLLQALHAYRSTYNPMQLSGEELLNLNSKKHASSITANVSRPCGYDVMFVGHTPRLLLVNENNTSYLKNSSMLSYKNLLRRDMKSDYYTS